jgi:hypothetical protein
MQGNLSEIHFDELLAFAVGGRKTGVLTLRHGNETVAVYLQEGQIVHATCPVGDGEKAIYYPITWADGSFSLNSNNSAPVITVQKGSDQILDDLRETTREWKQITEVIPSGQCVFQLADLGPELNGPITIPHVAWRVLCKIDGRRSVQEIAAALKAPYAQTAKIVFSLSRSGLVALVPTAAHSQEITVAPELLTKLIAQLTEVMGPIAPFIVRDQIRALNESAERFPRAKLGALIDLVSREISDAELRGEFETAVVRDITFFGKSHS